MINKEEYEKLIREGKKIDWYGEKVPEKLITNGVKAWCEMVEESLDKLISDRGTLTGKSKETLDAYVNGVRTNIKTAPYKLNGDFYLMKKKRIEADMVKESPKPKPTRKKRVVKKTTNVKSNTSNTVSQTKNSGLIFGNKK